MRISGRLTLARSVTHQCSPTFSTSAGSDDDDFSSLSGRSAIRTDRQTEGHVESECTAETEREREREASSQLDTSAFNIPHSSASTVRRLERSLGAAVSSPTGRTDESALDFYHQAKQHQAQSALETLCNNANMNSASLSTTGLNSVSTPSPGQSTTVSPIKASGPKYITIRSVMYDGEALALGPRGSRHASLAPVAVALAPSSAGIHRCSCYPRASRRSLRTRPSRPHPPRPSMPDVDAQVPHTSARIIMMSDAGT
eukprot:1541006-Rhodomonas_salina.4